MQYIKRFEDFIKEGMSVSNSDGVHPYEFMIDLQGVADVPVGFTKQKCVCDYVNTKVRTVKYNSFAEITPPSLGKRGGNDLINNNKVVMKKKTEDLNIKIDSDRLEYVWRYISEHLDNVLKDKKIVVGDIIADNIIKENGNVSFDFVFKDKDSQQNTDPSGQTKKKILAGNYINAVTKLIPVVERQVWIETAGELKLQLPVSKSIKEKLNNVIGGLVQGFKTLTNIGGTYWFSLAKTGVWFTFKTPADISNMLLSNPKCSLSTPNVYRMFGLDPKTQKVVGPEQPNIVI
jgi:hypothetical protein